MGALLRQYIRPMILLGLALLPLAPGITQPPARRLIDSLQQALANSRSDSQRIQLLTGLSANYFGTKPDSGILWGRQAIELSRKAALPGKEAEARLALAACLWGSGQHLQAIDEYRLVIPLAEKSGNRRMQAQIQHGIAINYGAIDQKAKAITFLKRSLELQLQDGNDSGAMGCYHNLAQYSNEIGSKDTALHYYEQALIHAERAKHGRGIPYTYMRLGEQMALIGKPANGFGYLEKALSGFEQLKDTSGVAECWAVRALVHRHLGQYPKAVTDLEYAIWLQRKISGLFFQRILSGYLMDLASVVQQLPQTTSTFRQRENAWTESLNIARKTEDWHAGARSAQGLSDLYRQQGNYALALRYFEEYIRQRDRFLNIEKAKELNRHELQTQYNDSIAAMKKLQDKQLTIVKQESALREAGIIQTRLYALTGVVLLALLLSILLYRNRIQKLRFRNEMQQSAQEQERKEISLQKQIREATLSALQAQMNPHFIFNALNVIQSFVYAGEKDKASYLIGQFSDLVRQTLQFSRSAMISLEDELTFIRAYTELEINRMPPGLHIEFDIAPNLELNRILLPPLLIQPFVENALRHGLYHKEGDRRLHIRVSGSTQSVMVEIDDNGVGRIVAKSYANKVEHLSFASGANAERVTLLNQLEDIQIDLQTIDKIASDGSSDGTTVRITIAQTKT